MDASRIALFDLLEPDVFNNHLWPLLNWNDLLRIRRVCHAGKEAVDVYLKSSPKSIPYLEIEIDEDLKSLEKFLMLGIPLHVKHVFINNATSGVSLFETMVGLFDQFFERHSSCVTKLKVHTLSVNPLPNEVEFLNRFVNLYALEVLNWVRNSTKICTTQADEADTDMNIPESCLELPFYRNLVEIVSKGCPESVYRTMLLSTQFANQRKCPNLISLTIPLAVGPKIQANSEFAVFMEKIHQRVQPFIYVDGIRVQVSGSLHPSLRSLTFDQTHIGASKDIRTRIWETASRAFIAFLEDVLCIEGFTMDMVNANWFACASQDLVSGAHITSMINIHPNALQFVTLEKLTRLDVISSQSNVWNHRDGHVRGMNEVYKDQDKLSTRPDWDYLESINIIIDSDMLAECHGVIRLSPGSEVVAEYRPLPVVFLFDFLFEKTYTENLRKLTVDFKHIAHWKPNEFTILDIVTSCPNIRKLGLANWPGTNKGLTLFWAGLPELDEVTLKSCKGLANVAFVGTDIERPVFLRLKNLKKLSLLDLDEMPKISDNLFKLVLSKIKLTQLRISSKRALNQVSVGGIRSLLNGVFATSIEKFPFNEWSINRCSTEEFSNLERSFRSYYMI